MAAPSSRSVLEFGGIDPGVGKININNVSNEDAKLETYGYSRIRTWGDSSNVAVVSMTCHKKYYSPLVEDRCNDSNVW